MTIAFRDSQAKKGFQDAHIGKKPIPLPAGVKYKVEGNTVLVEGPKGKVSAMIANGITLKTADGHLQVERASDDKAAVHG